ncbi:MAG: tRNA dihydrouridine synthase DusB [Clostridia bacterium]|nr:tRNA dihydrouridine synthase DusB [Clostridia bacterium]
MLFIGKTKLEYGLMLAPMAGATDRATREICREHGAEYTVSEMISSAAIKYGDEYTLALGRLSPGELPAAVQIFGHDPGTMAYAAEKVLEDGEKHGAVPSAVDINMGCPVRKIVGNGDGSALMKTPSLICDIVSAVKKAVPVPVTVKIRTGWDAEHKNGAEAARAAEAGGASLITVHGRTRADMYGPGVDLLSIGEIKRAVSVPVVGNGDINCAADALKMFSETGCDGIMVGRGAIGRPWIFSEIRAALTGSVFVSPDAGRIVQTALDQLGRAAEYKGERTAVAEGRRLVAAYFRGFRGAPRLRDALNRCETLGEARDIILSILPMPFDDKPPKDR